MLIFVKIFFFFAVLIAHGLVLKLTNQVLFLYLSWIVKTKMTMDLSSDTLAILNSIVSNSCYAGADQGFFSGGWLIPISHQTIP